jgi:RNA polymerase sigma-70 factor (ECF subfamily)
MVGVAESLVGDRAAAEEAAQEVMLELWRRRASITIETAIAAYLFRAVRNRALNQLRSSRTRLSAEPQLAAASGGVTPSDARVREHELRAAFEEALASLPPRCREVFELSRGAGMRYSEIADALGISVKTVEAQMGKALRIMRERLAEWLPSADM